MAREIFSDSPQYDASKPSPIKGYVHLDSFRFPNPHGRLSPETIKEIQELALQSLANWPAEDPAKLVSNRANISDSDVHFAIVWLRNEGAVTTTWNHRSGYETEFTYNTPPQTAELAKA